MGVPWMGQMCALCMEQKCVLWIEQTCVPLMGWTCVFWMDECVSPAWNGHMPSSATSLWIVQVTWQNLTLESKIDIPVF